MYVGYFLEGVASRSVGDTALLAVYREVVESSRATHLPFEDVQIPVVAAGGKRVEPSIGQCEANHALKTSSRV